MRNITLKACLAVLCLLGLAGLATSANAQFGYAQNFDSMGPTGSTLPSGWTAGYLGAESSVNRAVMSPYAGNGLSITAMPLVVSDGSALPTVNVGTVLNLGTTGGSDRSLGGYPRTTPSGDQIMQVALQNTSGGPLTAIKLSYWGEQWRQAQGTSTSGPEILRVLASSTSATNGFTSFPGLDFTAPKQLVADAPVGGLDGNVAANRAFVTGTITFSPPVPDGGTFYVRWHDWNDNGTSDHFLAIDDVQFSAASINQNLIAHLGFDNDLNDDSGNGIHGTAKGTVPFVRGQIGSGAISVTSLKDGSSFNYVSLGAPPQLNFGSNINFSISMWVNFTNWAGDPSFIANKNWDSGNNQGYVLATAGDGRFQWNLKEGQGSGTGGSRKDYDGPAATISDGKWHQIAVSFQRNGNAYTYLDGKPVSTNSIAPGLPTLNTPAGMVTAIGQDGRGTYTDGNTVENKNLWIDDVGIWGRVLSEAEVAAIYNDGLSGKNLLGIAPPKVPQVLFVTSATVNASDAAISNRLATLGYGVTIVADTASQTSQSVGKDLILVSSTVGSGNLLSGGIHKFRDVAIPVINWESANYDDLEMSRTAFGTIASQTAINIVNPGHPLAAGLPAGTNTILTSAQSMAYAAPNNNATVVAQAVGDASRALLFVYERGDELFSGITAAERRIGIPLDNNSPVVLTTDGLAIFDAAVRWANPANPAPVIVTQPAATTTIENIPASLRVEANGARPFSYQWLKNGTAIPGATGRAYTVTPAFSDNGAVFSVSVANASGSVTSVNAVLTVLPDTTSPTLVSASTLGNPGGLTVVFSEPVSATSGLNAANYTINGVTVTAASFGASSSTVVLVTSTFTEGTQYTLTVKDVPDRAATPNAIAPNPSTSAISLAQGIITRKFFQFGADPGGLPGFTNNARFPNDPTSIDYPTSFEWPPNAGNEAGSNYGDQWLGYLHPPLTGNYILYVSGDDQINLFLSTDDNPTNKRVIAFEPEWNNARQWLVTDRRNAANPQNISSNIFLEAGKKYFVEVLHREGGGGDSMGVTWQLPGVTNRPANGSPPISGVYLSSITPSGPVTVTAPPASQTITEPQAVRLTVGVNGTPPYAFQWYKDGVAIAGATQSDYIISLTAPRSGGAYSVVVSNFFSSATSASATLSVLPDKSPPTIVSVSGNQYLNSVTVVFSEPVAPATATNLGNYSLSGGLTISGVQQSASGQVLVLTTSAQGSGTDYVLTINGIADRAETPNTLAGGSQKAFKGWVLRKGVLLFEAYDTSSNPGVEVSRLTGHANYPNFPREQLYMTNFNTRSVYPDDSHEQYGARISGFFTPATNGNYRFFLRSDDASQLFMNTNSANSTDPTGKVLIAKEDDCCDSYGDASGGPAVSPNIAMVGGQSYYIEALLKEGGGGDYAQVAVREQAVTGNPPNAESIPGNLLATYAFSALNTAPFAIADSIGGIANETITIPVAKLLANDVDLDGDPLSIIAIDTASTQGGTVTMANNNVVYVPRRDFTGIDTFNYTITDNASGNSGTTVTVKVSPANVPSYNTVGITPQPSGSSIVKFAGIPGRTYTVQASDDLATWTTLGTAKAGPTGTILFEDVNAGNFNLRFYRTVWP